MKQPKLFLRIAVACFSMLLIGGYVYLRAGGEAKVFSGSKSARVTTAPSTTSPILPGSKGGVVALPGSKSFTLTTPVATQPVRDPNFLISSSKSAPVLLPSEVAATHTVVITGATTQPALSLSPAAGSQKPTTVLPGSKFTTVVAPSEAERVLGLDKQRTLPETTLTITPQDPPPGDSQAVHHNVTIHGGILKSGTNVPATRAATTKP